MKEVISDQDREKSHSTEHDRSFGNLYKRSELAQEIISRKPDFLERWTLFIIFGILLLMLATTWFIKYPDIIQVTAKLTAQNAPKEIVTRQNGRLTRLFVHNNELVCEHQIIGWIESTANHSEVLELSMKIDSSIALLNASKANRLSFIFNDNYSNLGEIQPAYQRFITAWQQYNDYMINGFYVRKKKLLESDINSLFKTQQTIKDREKLTNQDLQLAEETYKMNKTLAEQKVLTSEEFRTAQSVYFNKKMAVPQLNASLLANETQKRDKLKEIDQLDHDMAQQKEIFQQTLQSLKSEVDEWKKNYVLISPIRGKVYFVIPLQENQYLPTAKLLGYVNPADTHYYAEANLPQYNFGKVDTGLNVQLRFDAYPYQEVGFVEGKINYISSVPTDSVFLTSIRLNRGLLTNNGKTLIYKNGLTAQAIIITRNMRLFDRLYFNIIKSTSIGQKQ